MAFKNSQNKIVKISVAHILINLVISVKLLLIGRTMIPIMIQITNVLNVNYLENVLIQETHFILTQKFIFKELRLTKNKIFITTNLSSVALMSNLKILILQTPSKMHIPNTFGSLDTIHLNPILECGHRQLVKNREFALKIPKSIY